MTDARDPLGLRADAPLLDGWLGPPPRPSAATLTPMCTPGHKQRQDLTGAVVAGDTPLYGGVDTIKHADTLLADAESRAARLWGADWCRFSVAGSTHGNQALALAVGTPGREVIVTRCLHRSLLLGLVLAGLRPVWVLPERDPATGLPGAVAVRTRTRRPRCPPGACAVFLGDPPTWAPPETSPGTRMPPTRRASRSSWMPPGRRTWVSTPTCRRTRSPRARTRW